MEIKSDSRNELFKRNEISGVVEAEKNPGFDVVRKMISEKTGKPEENIDVYNVRGSFGSNKFGIGAYVYGSKEDLEKAIQKTRKQRREEKKAGEEKAKVDAEKKMEEIVEGKPSEVPVEDKVEQTEEKPVEAPVEDKAEEEKKAVKEEQQKEEEAKEN